MKLRTTSFDHNAAIPTKLAFGKYDERKHVALSDNVNPHLQWEGVPEGAKSFVLICHDSDVPSEPDDVNQEQRTVPYELDRVDFFHWVLVDIPVTRRSIAEGEFSDKVAVRGKSGPDAGDGMRHGLNDYTGWFAGDPAMKGDYFGYDGPCPPWNDERLHHYHFTIYALKEARCPVDGFFTGPQVRAAIDGLVLASATVTGTYAIYPKARK